MCAKTEAESIASVRSEVIEAARNSGRTVRAVVFLPGHIDQKYHIIASPMKASDDTDYRYVVRHPVPR